MARPNVTVIINDESFVISGAEDGGNHVSGFVSLNSDLLKSMGDTAERGNSYATIDDLNDWVGRLKTTAPTGWGNPTGTDDPTEYPFYHLENGAPVAGDQYAGLTFSRWPNGPTGSWKNEWWAVNNYLTYGGGCVVADYDASSANSLTEGTLQIDSVFCASTVAADVNEVINVVESRGDCIGIIGIPSSTDPNSISLTNASENLVYVYGEKVHRDWRRINSSVDPTSEEVVTSSLAADVAGCLSRTDRVSNPWFSPAGARRGQILDVIRLARNLSPTEQDIVYTAKVNPVVSFPGEGTILFGDKTSAPDSSTLSRINVARLFLYLKRTIGRSARSILFELNDDVTRTSFVNAVTPFLDTLIGQRAITEFQVVCDETNNTADIVDSNQFVADVFVKPTKSINFIRLRFTNVSSGVALG